MHLLEPLQRSWVRRRLLAWFARNARDLPWRRTRDAYAIWVSEVLLQQTQVATVIPYYERFLRSFPDVRSLAGADEQEVLRHWEGLGYYRRARDLHRAARLIVAQMDGVFPDDVEALGALPGLGRYTVGAVLSQAFDRRLPILEANSIRVLCRLLGVRDDPSQGTVRRLLWQVAEALLPVKQVGQFNQALMELGALVCKPVEPRCGRCPLAKHCRARSDGSQDEIPKRPRELPAVAVSEVAMVVRRRADVLLVRRPAIGRWPDLWEFPHTPLAPGESHEQAGSRLLGEVGLHGEIGAEITTIRHGVTRFRITLVCLEARYRRGRFRSAFYPQGQWLALGALSSYPVSAPQRRLMKALAQASARA